MSTVLNLKKARQVIKLDDSPDSPEFVLDLTDKNLVAKSKPLYERFQKKQDVYERIENGSESDEDLEQMGVLYKDVITTMLGEEAYLVICEFIKDDNPDIEDDDILLLQTPVVLFLLEQVGDTLTANNNSAVLKYARSKSAAAGAI